MSTPITLTTKYRPKETGVGTVYISSGGSSAPSGTYYTKTESDARFLALSGGTLTGDVTLDSGNGKFIGDLTGNADTATQAYITLDESTEDTFPIAFINEAGGSMVSGNKGLKGDNDFHYDPLSGSLTLTNVNASLSGTADVATTITVSQEDADTACRVLFTGGTTGNLGVESNGSLLYNAADGIMTAVEFTADYFNGDLVGNASTVTTNANLSGPIKSVGNTTSITSQTGTGTQFAMSTGPTFTNPKSSTTATAASELVRLDQMNSAIAGLDWQQSVLASIDLTDSEPTSPSVGDRYINEGTGTSNVTSQSVTIEYIYEWNGVDWTETIPNEGYTVWDENEDTNYVFNGTTWVEFGSTVSHNNTTGLQGGTTSQYYHLTSAQHTTLTGFDPTDYLLDTTDTFTGILSITDTGATPLVLERTASSNNVGIEYKNQDQSWYAGQGSGNLFGIGVGADLGNTNTLFQMTSTGFLKLNTTGAIYSGSPSLHIEDTTGRATVFVGGAADTPSEIMFLNNDRFSWGFSSRQASSNYQFSLYAANAAGTGWNGNDVIRIQQDGEFLLQESTNGENMIWAVPDGAVTLYHNGIARIATSSSGVDITDDLNVSDNIILSSNAAEINAGTADASDDQYFALAGGGAALSARGAVIILSGNENSTYNGSIRINPGSGTQDEVVIDGFVTIGNTTVDITGTLNVSSATTIAGTFITSGALNFTKVQTTDDSGRYITWKGGAAGTTVRGYLGFGHTGAGANNIFTGESADSFGIRAQGDLHLGGGGNNLQMTLDGSGVEISDPLTLSGLAVRGTETYLVAIDASTGLLTKRPASDFSTGGTTYTFSTGLTESAGAVSLGGFFSSNILIYTASNTYTIETGETNGTGTYTSYYQSAGSIFIHGVDDVAEDWAGITIQDEARMLLYYHDGVDERQLEFTSTEMFFTDTMSSKGVVYAADYSTAGVADDRWIPDYGAVKSYAEASLGNPSVTGYVLSSTTAGVRSWVNKANVNQTMYIGTTGITINRASSALTLAGITLTTPNIGVATGTSFNSITGLATADPLIDGTVAVGTSTLVARQDHVHSSSKKMLMANTTLNTDNEGTQENFLTLPALAIIYDIKVYLATVFNDGDSDELSIGISTSLTRYVNTINIGSGSIIGFKTLSLTNIPDRQASSVIISALYDGGDNDATVGSVEIYVYYSMPL